MPHGDPYSGLLRAMIEVVRERGAPRSKKKGHHSFVGRKRDITHLSNEKKGHHSFSPLRTYVRKE
jgi:hypothetical protein